MRIIGVCGGNGVILFPMRRYLIGNVEPRAVFRTRGDVQWKANFKDIPLYNNLPDLDVDVVIGGPDCGHSSLLSYSRKKSLSDPKDNASLNMYLDSINKYKPKAFIMENLPKLLDTYPPEYWSEAYPDYVFNIRSGSMESYGNSQKNRIRLVIIGIRKDMSKNDMSSTQYHFSNIYKVNKIQTNKELIKGLKEESLNNGNIREDIDDIITMYSGFKISLRKVRKYWINNKETKRWPAKDRKFTTAPAVYINRAKGYPAVARKANRQFNHKGLQLTPRELARIQNVPDRFKIVTLEHSTYWINKGRTTVTKSPPYDLGKWFYKQLRKSELWD